MNRLALLFTGILVTQACAGCFNSEDPAALDTQPTVPADPAVDGAIKTNVTVAVSGSDAPLAIYVELVLFERSICIMTANATGPHPASGTQIFLASSPGSRPGYSWGIAADDRLSPGHVHAGEDEVDPATPNGDRDHSTSNGYEFPPGPAKVLAASGLIEESPDVASLSLYVTCETPFRLLGAYTSDNALLANHQATRGGVGAHITSTLLFVANGVSVAVRDTIQIDMDGEFGFIMGFAVYGTATVNIVGPNETQRWVWFDGDFTARGKAWTGHPGPYTLEIDRAGSSWFWLAGGGFQPYVGNLDAAAATV